MLNNIYKVKNSRHCKRDSKFGPNILYGLLLILCFGLFARQAAYCTIRYFENETTVSLDIQRYFLKYFHLPFVINFLRIFFDIGLKSYH